jgi:hypothetical protein
MIPAGHSVTVVGRHRRPGTLTRVRLRLARRRAAPGGPAAHRPVRLRRGSTVSHWHGAAGAAAGDGPTGPLPWSQSVTAWPGGDGLSPGPVPVAGRVWDLSFTIVLFMQSTQFELHIGARGLAAMDYWSGKSDPYYIVYATSDRRQLCKSETIMTDLSPDWQPQVLYVKTLISAFSFR